MGIKEKIENAKVTNWLTSGFSKKEIESIRKSAKKKVDNKIIKEESNMGTWGYKVLENDAVLDVLYNISIANKDRKNALYKYTESTLKTRFDSKEHEIVLAIALVDAYVNGADKRILGGHGDTFYGYKDFFNKEGDIFHKNNDLPDFTTLVDDAILAGKYLLTIENDLGWSKPNIRKTVIEQIMLRLLMYKNDFEPNMELLAIHDIDEDDVKVKEE